MGLVWGILNGLTMSTQHLSGPQASAHEHLKEFGLPFGLIKGGFGVRVDVFI